MTRENRVSHLEKIHHISNRGTNKQVIDNDQAADQKLEQFKRELENMTIDDIYELANRLRPRDWGRSSKEGNHE